MLLDYFVHQLFYMFGSCTVGWPQEACHFAEKTHVSNAACAFVPAASTLNVRFNPSLDECGIWLAVHHKSVQRLSGFVKRKLTARFKSVDIKIGSQVLLDRAAVGVRDHENDRVAPDKTVIRVEAHRICQPHIVSV